MNTSEAAKNRVDQFLALDQYEDAFALASEWAIRGEAWAQGSVGSFHLCGIATPIDLTEAERWLRLAIENGDALACHNLATLLAVSGKGTAKQNDE